MIGCNGVYRSNTLVCTRTIYQTQVRNAIRQMLLLGLLLIGCSRFTDDSDVSPAVEGLKYSD